MSEPHKPEMASRPLGLILPSDEDMALWHTLSERQRGFALHWMRSNLHRRPRTEMRAIVRRAQEQRP